MKAKDTLSNTSETKVATVRQHARGNYRKVFDARKRRVRGLWERNGAFYAQITVPDPQTGRKAVRRVRMEDKDGNPVASVAEAVKVLQRLRVKREDDTLRIAPKRVPTFAEYFPVYLDRLEKLGVKRSSTIRLEREHCKAVTARLGHLRLREITPAVIRDTMTRRKAAGLTVRSVNLDLQVLRNVLKSAVEDGHLAIVPEVKRLREPKPMRRLLSAVEIEAVADAALDAEHTGQMVSDFIRLMAYSGGRWGETLRLRWRDVDMNRRQLHFGADGLSKNGEARAVDFNPKLEAHLKAMAKRKAPDSEFLFPSRLRAEGKDLPSVTFNMTIRAARTKASVPGFTCHACRHFFASMALMSGVDLHTVAAWLGHKDNGVLLARTYSHLLGSHKAEQAQRVNFGPVAVAKAG